MARRIRPDRSLLHCSRGKGSPATLRLRGRQAPFGREAGGPAEPEELQHPYLNWFLPALPGPGGYHSNLFTRGTLGEEAVVGPAEGPLGHARDLYVIYEIALRLFDSETLREHVLAEADYYLWEGLAGYGEGLGKFSIWHFILSNLHFPGKA